MLGAGNPKCKNCQKTAYSQESIVYDNQTYHKRCFRCTKCDSVVSLGKVAMIQGDLYCKTCFLRMFSEKGTYHVFGTKTLPKHMLAGMKSESADASTSEAFAEFAAGDNKEADKPKPRALSALKDAQSPSSGSGGSPRSKTCVVDDCTKPRVAGRSWCDEHLAARNTPSSAVTEGIDALFQAIRSKSVPEVQNLLHKNGVSLCLETKNRKSALQFAFSEEGSAACGEAMVEALADYLKDLEADVAMLKDQMAPESSAASPTPVPHTPTDAAPSPAPEPAATE